MHSSKQYIFILTLIFAPVLMSAQNWCTIKKNSLNYFQNSYGDYKAIKIKVVQMVGNDSVLYPVKESNYNFAGWCEYIDTTSIIGMKMSIKPNGNNIFYDSAGLEFDIHTLANIGDTWTFFRFKDSSRFVAKVDSMYFNQIVSWLSDSVKVISFSYVDKYGNEITHPANNAQIRISKNYGLIKFWNFIEISRINIKYSFVNYTIAGMSNPKVGYQNLDASLLYNFNVGDEFHSKYYYENSYSYVTDPFGYTVTTKVDSCIKKILDKSETKDTFYYKTYRHQHIYQYYYDIYYGNVTETFDTIYKKDTIIEKYSKSNADLERLPYEAIWTFYMCVANGQYRLDSYKPILSFNNIRTKQNDRGMQVKFGIWDTCLASCQEYFPDYENYYEGLGGPYYHRSLLDDYPSPMESPIETNDLVYFKKGTKQWGKPIILKDPNKSLSATSFYINPNPASDHLKISSHSEKNIDQLIFTDISGNIQKQINNINSSVYEMDCSTMNKGLYIVSIISGREVFRKRLIIMR